MVLKYNSLRLTLTKEASDSLAAKIAKLIKTPQLVELVGDLGGGKTTFAKSLGKALGVSQTITSPTFNIHRSYGFPGGKFEHFDLYRLSDDEIVFNELEDCLSTDGSVVVVEWAQHFTKNLSDDYLTIEFLYRDEETRDIIIVANGPKSQKIVEDLS